MAGDFDPEAFIAEGTNDTNNTGIGDVRSIFANELKDPNVSSDLYRLTYNEVGQQGPEAQQAFLETVFNRALARGTSISDVINDRAYYSKESYADLSKDATDQDKVDTYQNALNGVIKGSNISSGATGNASGKTGFGGGPQTAEFNGEKFGIEAADTGQPAILALTPGEIRQKISEEQTRIASSEKGGAVTEKAFDPQEFIKSGAIQPPPSDTVKIETTGTKPISGAFDPHAFIGEVPEEPQEPQPSQTAQPSPAPMPAPTQVPSLPQVSMPQVPSMPIRLATNEEYLNRIAPIPQQVLNSPAGQAVLNYVKEQIPSSFTDIARSYNVPTGLNDPIGIAAFSNPMVRLGVNVIQGALARYQQVKAAEQTPPWSQARWNAGVGTVMDIASIAALADGAGRLASGRMPAVAQEVVPASSDLVQQVNAGLAEADKSPIGAANRVAAARAESGLLGSEGAPNPGIGVGWHDSVTEGNALIDQGTNPYNVAADFQKNGLINRQRMGVMRAWLERLQRANAEATGALEQDPGNVDLARLAQEAQDAENSFWKSYQPMKTEWSNIGTGMQETRGISDTDLLSQQTAEQSMREHLGRELKASEKAAAAKAVKETRTANEGVDVAFKRAVNAAASKARGPVRDLATLKRDLANKLKQLTPC